MSKTKNLTKARANGVCLRTEKNGNEISVRAHCFTWDNSGVYLYTDIYSLMNDMSNNHFYGNWDFSDYKGQIKAICSSCCLQATQNGIK